MKVVPVGVNKAVKKLLQEKFPNMSRLEDISELLVKCVGGPEGDEGPRGAFQPILKRVPIPWQGHKPVGE